MDKIKLDLKDKKILLALDMGARSPDSQIAKVVGLSKQITNYRIKRLEKQGIIQSYYPVIDHTKLGLKLYRVALKLENTTKEKEKEILTYLKKQTSWIASVLGVWDLSLGLYVEDEYHFMEFWNKFYQKFGFHIEKRWVTLMTTFWNYERSFILPRKKDREKQFILGQDPVLVKTDEIDQKIMRELTKNARKTTLEIAQKLNTTERIVRYRLKRLEKEKVILGYRPFLNSNVLNLKFFKVYIQLKDTSGKELKKIASFIVNNPYIAYRTEALAGFDFELEVFFTSSHELYDFLSDLKEKFPRNIRNMSHIEYIKEYKVTYYPSVSV